MMDDDEFVDDSDKDLEDEADVASFNKVILIFVHIFVLPFF